jgi:hypothetical protein
VREVDFEKSQMVFEELKTSIWNTGRCWLRVLSAFLIPWSFLCTNAKLEELIDGHAIIIFLLGRIHLEPKLAILSGIILHPLIDFLHTLLQCRRYFLKIFHFHTDNVGSAESPRLMTRMSTYV